MKKKFILSFIIPAFIVTFCFMIKSGINSNTIMISDMGRQYIGFFSNYQNIVMGKESAFYSFSNGLGASNLMDIFYYLGSPINLILLFFSKTNLTIGIFIIILLKIGLSGLTMCLFLSRKFKLSDYMVLLFSICYALMSYNINLYFNTMWIDAVYMTPLVLIGIDKVLDNKKTYMYILLLSFNIIINFYTGYFCSIFYLLYFLWNLYNKNKDNKFKILKKFIFSSIYAGLISAVVLIPLLFNLDYNSRPVDYISISNIKESFEGIIMFLTYLLPFTYNVNRVEGAYNIHLYCGLIIIIFVNLYFFNKKIDKKEKISSLMLFLFFILSFIINPLTYFWHGFSWPIGYHFRFSFLFSIFIIILAATFYEKSEFSVDALKKVFFILFVILIGVILFNSLYDKKIFVLIGLIYLIYAIILLNNKKYSNRQFEFILLIVAILELGLNCYNNLITSKNYDSSYIKGFSTTLKSCPSIDTNYRVNMSKKNLRNEGLLCDVHGTGYSSSNINNKVKKFYQKIGAYASSSYYYFDSDNTTLMQSLLGIKYYQNNDEFITNDKALSIGYMISDAHIDKTEKNPLEYQNNIINSMIGEKLNVLKPYKKINEKKGNKGHTFTYYIDNDNEIYFSIYHDFTDYVYGYNILDVYVDEKLTNIIGSNGGQLGVLNIENKFYGNDLNIKLLKRKLDRIYDFKNYDFDNLYVYYEDKKELDYAINELSKHQLKVTKWEKNVLEGSINVDVRKNLFLSIPYEEGWQIYVDGNKTDYFELYDAFIGIKLDKGKHKIKMKFYPKGLKLGIIVSSISLFGLLFHFVIIKKLSKRQRLEK